MKKNNDIQEWLRLYDTSVIPENKMNELISAGKKYMALAMYFFPAEIRSFILFSGMTDVS